MPHFAEQLIQWQQLTVTKNQMFQDEGIYLNDLLFKMTKTHVVSPLRFFLSHPAANLGCPAGLQQRKQKPGGSSSATGCC